MDEININQQCMEKILIRLTELISFNELEDIRNLEKLVNMATCVSAQLNAINTSDGGEII